MRPAKAEVPLRLKSPSRPCPIASCRRMPGQPGPQHDRHRCPPGRPPRSSLRHGLARRLGGEAAPAPFLREEVEGDPPAPAVRADLRLPPSSAIAVTFSRVSGRTSPTVQPEAVAISMTTSSLAMRRDDLLHARIGGARLGVDPPEQVELAGEVGQRSAARPECRDRAAGPRLDRKRPRSPTRSAIARACRAASSRFLTEISSVWA